MNYTFLSKEHIHLLDDKPLIGCTSALDIISKNLTWWASEMCAREFGFLNPKKSSPEDCENAAKGGLALVKALDLKEYRALLDRAYRAHNAFKKKRAEEGIDLHSEIEKIVKMLMEGNIPIKYPIEVEPFVVWAKRNVRKFIASEVHCYSSRLWTGGIVDLIYEDSVGNLVVGDIKSSKDVYFNHFVQCGGYSVMLQENGGFDSNGKKVLEPIQEPKYLSVFPMGQKDFQEPTIHSGNGMGIAFEAALELYKERQRFENGGYGYGLPVGS